MPVKVAVNVSSSGKPVLRCMYYVNELGLTLHMKTKHSSTPLLTSKLVQKIDLTGVKDKQHAVVKFNAMVMWP